MRQPDRIRRLYARHRTGTQADGDPIPRRTKKAYRLMLLRRLAHDGFNLRNLRLRLQPTGWQVTRKGHRPLYS